MTWKSLARASIAGAGWLVLAASPVFAAPAAPTPEKILRLVLQPARLDLQHGRDVRRVLVTGLTAAGAPRDLTAKATFQPANLVSHVGGGYLAPTGVGKESVKISVAGLTAALPVQVKRLANPPVSFVRDIEPILAKSGCNAGTCHGAAKGKNGFKLSLRGYDLAFDYEALVDDISGRRFNRAAPENSLLLQKPVQQVPHQGGLVFETHSRHYRLLRQWIAEGVKSDVADTSRVARLEVLPRNPTMDLPGRKQQQIVIAHYADGSSRDVTRDARYTSSSTETAAVGEEGEITGLRRGEAAILVSYEGQFATNELTILGDRTGWKWSAPPQHNTIDRLVDAKLQRVRSLPSPLAGDAEFLRRVSLDLTGLAPEPAAARAFLADPRPSRVKRAALIEELLNSPEFDDHWTYKFADLLQVNRKYLGDKGIQAFRGWIHDSIAANKPFDQFVREILTASGGSYENPAASYFRVARDASTATEAVTQLFLGVRFSCNKCHDHPFERWTMQQYYELGAYFAQVGFKSGDPGEEVVYDRTGGEVMHPKYGKAVPPAYPVSWTGFAPPSGLSRRQALAEWLTSPQNPFFARSWANRIWSYFLGRGIIDPVDDIRNSNPPSNGPLLQHLTDEFITSGFDLRHLMRLIAGSRTYQASIAVNRWNEDDTTNFSHQSARRLTAEQLMDAISRATGSTPRYPGVPAGTLAQQLPDTTVNSGSFLDLFGRPARESPCECERTSEVSLAQALNLMNGSTIADAVADPNGRVARLVKDTPDNLQLVDEVYLAVFSRIPAAKERETAVQHITSAANRLEGAQDLMWALLNSPAFLFNR